MNLISLSSSSRGNVHLLETKDTCIMLDCGVKYSRISNELCNRNIDGILLTHEHGDHMNGCMSIAENKNIKFYSTQETLDKVNVANFMKCPIIPYETFSIKNFMITAFQVMHDASNPVNYLIKDMISNACFLYITDTGYIENLSFKDVDYILIECNFDESWYTEVELSTQQTIKSRRLLSNSGHLSLQKVLRALHKIVNRNTKQIILCHISSTTFDNEYLDFQKIVQAHFPKQIVGALNPHHIGAVSFKLSEDKDVMPFE